MGHQFKELPVYCRDCPRYDEESQKCRDGKVNPQHWEVAVTVAQTYGLRSICMFNAYREKLVQSRQPLPSRPGRRGR